MYLKSVSLFNFRKFGIKEDGKPGITVLLNPDFNLLVGENDSGKTAIIDAIRYLLGSLSTGFQRIKKEDFNYSKEEGYKDSFMIEGIFTDLSEAEAGAFLEWLSFDANQEYELRVVLKVRRLKNSNGIEYIDRSLMAGDKNHESRLDSAASNLLKTTYLKPLRDAEVELQPGVRSRLVHILKAHPAFQEDDNKPHKLVEIMNETNEKLEGFFDRDYEEGRTLTKDLEDLLKAFYDSTDSKKAKVEFSFTDANLVSILKRLGLKNEEINLGLGNLNLLFIAAELLLLNKRIDFIGPKITLIEEIEAHLHVQAQIRLIKYLEQELRKKSNSSQFILTSHSPSLIASVNPENLIFLYDGIAYPMNNQYTDLEAEDYRFLERFLDATKSNLFFAKGLILVEGISEMLLLPALAKLIGKPLHQFGVSLVNVEGTSFERYIKLFSRSKEWIENLKMPNLNIPIAIVTDIDVKPYVYYEMEEKKEYFFVIEDEDALSKLETYLGTHFKEEQLKHCGKNYSTLNKLAKDFKFNYLKEHKEKLENLLAKPITDDYIKEQASLKKELLEKKYNKYNCNSCLCIAPEWTLEFSLALSVLKKHLYKAVHINRYSKPLEGNKKQEYEDFLEELKTKDLEKSKEKAYEIFRPVNNKLVSKAEVAQTLACLIDDLLEMCPKEADKLAVAVREDSYLRYLVNAIEHACGGPKV